MCAVCEELGVQKKTLVRNGAKEVRAQDETKRDAVRIGGMGQLGCTRYGLHGRNGKCVGGNEMLDKGTTWDISAIRDSKEWFVDNEENGVEI